jgi:hypothetical protein
MNEVPPQTIRKIRTLAQIAAELRDGRNSNITRLTLLKSLCGDAYDAAAFALYIAKKTHQAMKVAKRSGRPPTKVQQRSRRLVGKAVRGMTAHLKTPSENTETDLGDLLSEIRSVQDSYEYQRWGPVRIIDSQELLVAETALKCVLNPWHSSVLGYHLARQYAERYNPRFGTGLSLESAPMVEDIAEFWGRHFLGRVWRKRLANVTRA